MERMLPQVDIRLLAGGQAFFPALCEAIEAARETVWLETYIFRFDATGERVAQALEQAARRGVQVRVLVDGVGTPLMPPEWVSRWTDAGVVHLVFSPVRWYSRLLPSNWRRLHRKLALIDGQVGFCGGINVVDDYWDDHLGALDRPRLDYSVQVSGPLLVDMADTLRQQWWRSQLAQDLRGRDVDATLRTLRARPENVSTPLSAPSAGAASGPRRGPAARLLLRDNVHHRKGIEQAYLKAIGRARREVLIANAYFVPGLRIRRALRHARRRGVEVTLLLQGAYEHFMQFHASRAVYANLLREGVRIVEYQAGHLHGKVAVIDGHWATVGSSNLDPLSLLLAREANVEIDDPVFADRLRQELLAAIARDGRVVEPAAFAGRPWPARLADWLALGAARVLVALTGNRFR